MEQNPEDTTQNTEINVEKKPETTKVSVFVTQIAKEVARERKRLVVNGFTIMTAFVLGVIGLTLWSFLATNNKGYGIIQFFLGFFIFFTFLLVVYSLMVWYKFRQEEKIHFLHTNQINSERLPIFAIDAYKRNAFWRIVISWFSFFTYFVLTIGMVSFFIASSLKDEKTFPIWVFEITIKVEGEKNFLVQKIIFLILIIGVFVLQLMTYIQTTKNVARLNALFDVDKKIDKDEFRRYKRNTNIVCAVVFLAPVIVGAIVFWLIKKLRKK